MKPMAGNIDRRPELIEDRPLRVEHGQDEAETHG